MKPASSQLLALLATREFFAVDLYTFVLHNNGGTLRYCAGDKSIYWNTNFYNSTGTYGTGSGGGPYFDRQDTKAKLHAKIGVETDTLQFDVIPGTATINGEGFLAACHDGIFDNATMSLDRAFMPTYGDVTAGVLQMFSGRVGEVDVGRSLATFSVNSWLEILNQNLPRNLFQPGCVNNLGDSACQVNIASYSTGLTVNPGSTQAIVNASISLPYPSYYDLGKVVFTSGVLNGQSRSVRVASIASVVLLAPFTVAPATGDTFTLYAGCDKSLGSNGCAKFSNQVHFRGTPYIPQPVIAT